jgi:hypothetical protein
MARKSHGAIPLSPSSIVLARAEGVLAFRYGASEAGRFEQAPYPELSTMQLVERRGSEIS